MNMLKDRLKAAIDANPQLTRAGLARACGVTKSNVTAWMNGNAASMASDKVGRAARYLGVRPEWLSDGRGAMSSFGADTPATHSVAYSPDTFDLYQAKVRKLPLLEWDQVGDMCKGKPVEAMKVREWRESPFVDTGSESFLLELATEAMLPEFMPGAIIQVDPSEEPRNGDDVVVYLPSGKATFRRLVANEDGSYLQAINPSWPDRISALPADAVIVGVVVGSWIGRRRR